MPLFWWQKKALSLRSKRQAIRVGRRSGKSTFLAVRLLVGPKGLAQGFNCALMAHKRDGVAAIESELIRLLGAHIVAHPRRDGYIFTPTGAELHIWTLGNKATSMRAGRGEKYGTVVIDEAAYCTMLWQAFFESIEPCLADYAGYVLFSGTPRGRANDFYRICQYADEEISGSTADCNPLPNIQEYYRDRRDRVMRGRLNPKVHDQEDNAQFVDIEEALVALEMIRRLQIEPKLPNPDAWTINVGVDFAFSLKEEADWCAMVAVARNVHGKLYIPATRRFKTNQPAVMLRELEMFSNEWKPSKICCESVQAQSAIIAGWKVERPDLPIVALRPEKDKLTRFMPTAQKYADGLIWHSKSIKQEFEDELTLFPISEHDDQCDALAYAVMGFGHYWDDQPTGGEQWEKFGLDDETGGQVYDLA